MDETLNQYYQQIFDNVTYNGVTGFLTDCGKEKPLFYIDSHIPVFVHDISIYDAESDVTHRFKNVDLKMVKVLRRGKCFDI